MLKHMKVLKVVAIVYASICLVLTGLFTLLAIMVGQAPFDQLLVLGGIIACNIYAIAMLGGKQTQTQTNYRKGIIAIAIGTVLIALYVVFETQWLG